MSIGNVRLWCEDPIRWLFSELGSEGVPEILEQSPIMIGPAGREFPADESTPASGRYYIEDDRFTAEQADWLVAQGMHITRAGTFDGPEWPDFLDTEEEPS